MEFAWIDIVGLGLLGLLGLLGFVRGLWWQVVRLVGIVLAFALARALGPRLDPTVQSLLPEVSEVVVGGLTRLAVFIGGLVVVALLGFIGKKSLETMKLGLADRVGGMLAGLLSGLVVHGAFVLCLGHFGTAEWSSSVLDGTVSQRLLTAMSDGRLITPETRERLRHLIDSTGLPSGFQLEPGTVEAAPPKDTSDEPRVR